jgi:hypothetical protein
VVATRGMIPEHALGRVPETSEVRAGRELPRQRQRRRQVATVAWTENPRRRRRSLESLFFAWPALLPGAESSPSAAMRTRERQRGTTRSRSVLDPKCRARRGSLSAQPRSTRSRICAGQSRDLSRAAEPHRDRVGCCHRKASRSAVIRCVIRVSAHANHRRVASTSRSMGSSGNEPSGRRQFNSIPRRFDSLRLTPALPTVSCFKASERQAAHRGAPRLRISRARASCLSEARTQAGPPWSRRRCPRVHRSGAPSLQSFKSDFQTALQLEKPPTRARASTMLSSMEQ